MIPLSGGLAPAPAIAPRPSRPQRRGALSIAGLLTLSFLLAALGVSFGGDAQSSGPNPPRGIHLSYLDDPTRAVVTWHTNAVATSRVEWGTSIGPPYPNAATGTESASPGGSFLHTVTLTGLTPGTRYYYRAGDATMNSWSGQWSFRAAVAKGAPDTFSFAAAGDWGNTSAMVVTASSIGQRDPNLVLGLGDYFYAPDDAAVRDFFEKWQVFAKGSFVQTAMGNHEHGAPGEPEYTMKETYCAFVNLPGNERAYTFTYGNTLFLAIDWGRQDFDQTDGADGTGGSCGGAAGTPSIRAWVDARLAAANADPDITWKVVFEHFLCYDTSHSPVYWLCSGTGNPDQIEDILVNRGVDLVLQAHDHTYGRTHPVAFGSPTQIGTTYDTPGAPMYFILGTGGHEQRTETCRSDPWVAMCRAHLHTAGFGHFSVSPTTIQYEFVENTAGVVDTFTLHKTPSSGFTVSVSPTSATMGRNSHASATVMVRGTSSGAVTLSATGCPSGVSCTFAPPSGNPTFTSTFSIDTGSSVPVGTHPITIVASNGTSSSEVNFTLSLVTEQTRTYQKGDGGAFSETDDTFLFAGAPNTSYGSNDTLRVDGSGCVDLSEFPAQVCRALVKFPDFLGPNAGQVPLGSRIVNATLDIFVTSEGFAHSVYQVTEAWTEGGATWNSFATPGMPANKGLSFTFNPTRIARFSLNITSMAQDWADGGANQGILIASVSDDGGWYASSETPPRFPPPSLWVTFEPPAPPAFDFAVSVQPTSGSVLPGETTQASVTATLTSGQSTSISFSTTGLPSGASASFNPTSCTPTCTSTLTISTTGNTPPGSYPISVRGSGGGLLRSATYTLIVEEPGAPFDFAVSVDPDSGSVAPGESTATTVTATLTSGEPVSVSFSTTGLPSGASSSFNPTTCTPTCSSTMTISTTGSTPPGTYPLTVRGSGGGLLRTATYTLVVEAPSPPFNFAVSVSPDSGTVDQGESTSSSVTATLTSGDPVSVSFSATGLPSGASASFAPSACVPTCTSTMTINTSPNTPTGTFTVTVRGNGGGLLRTDTYSLTVESAGPPFDFSVSVEPSSDTVFAGESTQATVTATLTSGQPVSVSFSATGLPSGASASFNPTSCVPTCSSTMTISTTGSTPAGTFTITVKGVGGGLQRTDTFTLTVENERTLTFRKGDGGAYSETDDSYIYSGAPLSNYGSATIMYVDADACIISLPLVPDICRSLIKFPNFVGPNNGQVPPGSTIVSAKLELYVTDPGSTQYMYQLAGSWSESTVTWLSFLPPGEPPTTGSPRTYQPTTTGWFTVDVTNFVQNWVDGDPNHGWFITSTGSNGVDYRTSESSLRPKLTVTFRTTGSGLAPPIHHGSHTASGDSALGISSDPGLPAGVIVALSGAVAFAVPWLRTRSAGMRPTTERGPRIGDGRIRRSGVPVREP